MIVIEQDKLEIAEKNEVCGYVEKQKLNKKKLISFEKKKLFQLFSFLREYQQYFNKKQTNKKLNSICIDTNPQQSNDGEQSKQGGDDENSTAGTGQERIEEDSVPGATQQMVEDETATANTQPTLSPGVVGNDENIGEEEEQEQEQEDTSPNQVMDQQQQSSSSPMDIKSSTTGLGEASNQEASSGVQVEKMATTEGKLAKF